MKLLRQQNYKNKNTKKKKLDNTHRLTHTDLVNNSLLELKDRELGDRKIGSRKRNNEEMLSAKKKKKKKHLVRLVN